MARIIEILLRLSQRWPEPGIELKFSNAYQLLVATILAAQCTDERVNKVTPQFFALYPTAGQLTKASLSEIEEQIRSTGFYHNKAKALLACCQQLVEHHQGEVPASVEELSALPGVGRKTASVVVANAYGVPAIAVDTHVKRVSERLALSTAGDANKIEADLRRMVPESRWIVFTQLLTLHGRYTCQARKPACGTCVLADLCDSSDKIN